MPALSKLSVAGLKTFIVLLKIIYFFDYLKLAFQVFGYTASNLPSREYHWIGDK